MTAPPPMNRLAVTVVGALLMTVLVVFYVLSDREVDSNFQDRAEALQHVKQLDTELQSDVFKARIGMRAHYDSINDLTRRVGASVERLEASLASHPTRLSGPARFDLAPLRQAIETKAALIEQFKTSNSLLRNSSAYLPVAASTVQDAVLRPGRLPDLATPGGRVWMTIDAMLLASLRGLSADTDDRIEQLLGALDREARVLTDAQRDSVATLGLHARLIRRERTRIDALLGELTAVPVGARVDVLTAALRGDQRRAIEAGTVQRALLLAFSIVVTALFVLATVRLARSHATIRARNEALAAHGRDLERIVEDRVRALLDSEARMKRLAQFDSLTGLPNRHYFGDRLAEAMQRADRSRACMALMFVDLDHFKQINDSLGHVVGDGVLTAVSARLRGALRPADTVARLGGDEFTIIVEGLGAPGAALRIATDIRQALASPLQVDGREFFVSASIGVAHYVLDSGDGDELLKAADIAMYRAKVAGRNRIAVFEPDMATRVSEQVDMKARLRRALERDEFRLHYQPKLALPDGGIAGVEALLRWRNDELGDVPPSRFIPLLEELGMIVPVGEWVLKTACAQGLAWHAAGLPRLEMAVNLSPRQLRDERIVASIAAVLADTGFPASSLELELTEGVIMDDVAHNVETLTRIRELGVRLAVDDFGTGYSSLEYLARLPIQTLKIDRGFVARLGVDGHASTIVTTMVTLAHSLSLRVVAEGVETEAQRQALVRLGCDQLQGYLFSRPVAPDALLDFALAHAPMPDAGRSTQAPPSVEAPTGAAHAVASVRARDARRPVEPHVDANILVDPAAAPR